MRASSGRTPVGNLTRAALLAAALLSSPALAEAQGIGIKGGLSFATFSDGGPDFDTKTGFAAGASLRLGGGLLALQPEALFVSKGPDGAQIRYFEVPVLLRVSLPLPAVSPFGVAGPAVAFRLSCDFTGMTDCPAGVEKRDYGVALGAGVRLGGRIGFTLEGRYTWGLKDVGDVTAGLDQQTRTFLILAGIEL